MPLVISLSLPWVISFFLVFLAIKQIYTSDVKHNLTLTFTSIVTQFRGGYRIY